MPIFQRDSLIVFLIFILPLFLRAIIATYHEIMATKPSNHHLNGNVSTGLIMELEGGLPGYFFGSCAPSRNAVANPLFLFSSL